MIDRIIQLALNNRLLMLVLGAVVMMSGYYGHRQLPVDAFPDVSPNLVQVFTVTEGLAPEEIETYVTYPIAGQVALPPGYLVTWGGQFRLQQEANKRLAIVVPVTLFVLFLLLFSSFNSLRNAVLILLNIPLALVGGVAALWLTGQNLSVPSSVVVGGLVSSTVLTLLVMPALYKWFAVRPDRGTAEGNLVESGEADR